MFREAKKNELDAVMISVIVPIYNVEKYLPRCLDSIAAQTYTDYELILVNDGSPDRCDTIMEDYARRDGRILLVYKENGGLSSARNAGLDIAQGKYVIFIDSDDYVKPTLFEDALRMAEESGADQVLWNYQIVDDEHEHGPYLKMVDEVINVDVLGLSNYFYRYWFPYRHGQEAWSKLYRRRIIEEYDLRFQLNHEILAEDTLFSAMYLLHSHTIAVLSKPYYSYYQRSGSIMNSPKPRAAHRLMTLAVRLCEYVKQQGRTAELKQILPVLWYTLCYRGIQRDPDLQDVYAAMKEFTNNSTARDLLHRLIAPMPLLLYTARTSASRRIHIRARLFALRWLRGDVRGAAALVQRQEG